MVQFFDLFKNPFFITAVCAWAAAQITKVVIHLVVHKEISIERLFGDGGMPSGHSATVSSLAMISALTFGTDSFEFAIAGILAIIVCHDAMGVRLETGKQAYLINEIVKSFRILSKEQLPEVKLKELVGHTPIQVLAGIVLGIVNAYVLYFFVF